MKKTLPLLGVLLLSGAAFAQAPPGGPGGPPNPEARFEHLATELKLSDAQKPQVKQALDDERSQLMASMKQERADHTDIQVAHQNHEKIEQAMVDKLKPVLSADQLTQFEGILKAEAAARHHRERAAQGGTPPAN